MKITGKIIEQLSSVSFYKNRAVIFNTHSYYEYFENKLSLLYKDLKSHSATIALDGLWIASNNESNYVDIFNLNKEYPQLNFNISNETHLINNKLLTKSTGKKPYQFIVINVDDLELKELSFNRVFKYSFDNEAIYIRSNGFKEIACYDYELNCKWKNSNLEGQIYLDFERKPQIHNDLLIINHAYDTIALDKQTGEEVWKYTFDKIPASNILMDGKIYAVCEAQLFVINPDNGEVLFKADTGYPSRIEEADKINRIGVFPVGEYLYGIADYNGKKGRLKLFNKDASELLDVTEFPDYYINPYGSILPTIHDGKIYQAVRNAYSYSDSGLLVLDISDNEKAGIKVADRPPVTVLAYPSIQDSHKLQIYLEVDNLDDALRYGELITKEVHYATGFIPVWDARLNALDSKHNGELELIIDDTGFEKDSEDYLNSLSVRLKEFLESDTCKAGDKRTPIKFTLIKQPKSDWDLSGEQLDWPAIRDQETPLS